MKKLITLVLLGTLLFAEMGTFKVTAAEADFNKTVEAISQADHDMAERMCGVCKGKIAKYKEELKEQGTVHEFETKTLETYEGRLAKFCAMKNQPVEN